jgi:uncharacterized protein YndB with AHSA1/START domain
MSRVSYSEKIAASPDQVWAILSDVTRLPDWAYTEGRFPYPVEGKYGSDQTEGPGTLWIGVAADGQIATQKITVWEPEKKLVYELQEMEHAPLQMTQTNTFDLEAMEDGTLVTWTVDWKITAGFSLNALLMRISGDGAFEETVAGSLENLKQLIEKAIQEDAPEAEKPEENGTE